MNMNSGIKTFYALKTFERKRFFWSKKKTVTEVVGVTQASNWMWATLHLAAVEFDELVQRS